MRIFIIGWDNTNKMMIDVALKLEAGGHKILYWAGTDQARFEADRAKFKNKIIFHDHLKASKGIRAEEFSQTEFTPPGEDFIANFFETESTLLTMKKFSKPPKFALEKKRVFHDFLEYWRGVIEELKPEAILFGFWPHSGYNYVIFELARFLGIKTIMFEYGRIADRSILINDYRIGSLALKEEIKKNENKLCKIEDLSPDIQEYYKKQTATDDYVLPPDIQSISDRYAGKKLLSLKLKMVLAGILDGSILKKAWSYAKREFIQKDGMENEYRRWQRKPDFTKPYIYVAPHYQPECSTSPLGGVFVDQILMIKILSAAVPAGWEIYVKEHPYQWKPYGQSYFAYRYKGYYESIAKLKNVSLAPMETSPVKLIKQSRAVATVTGTAGWEAAIRLKPALNFGHAWYRDCPGVFRVNSVDSCKKVLGEIINGYKIDRQEIINYLASLDKISFHGNFEKLIAEQSEFSAAEQAENIFKALTKEIEN